MNEVMQILTAFLGSLGFGILFNVRGKRLLAASFGGLFSWALFLVLGFGIVDEAVRYFIVSVAVSGYCEIMARVMRTPTTTFLMTALIPLIPGGGLYYTMTNAMSGDLDAFMGRGMATLSLAVALALGVVVTTVITSIALKLKLHKNKM